MDRKSFLKSIGLGSGSVLFFGAAGNSILSKPQDDKSMQFTHVWVKSLMEKMDSTLDEKSKINLMESCGRACANRGAIKIATESAGDVEKLIEKLQGMVGKENVIRNGNSLRLIYKECYCPLVKDIKEKLSDTYCNCSRGWVREMFETVVQKPLEVVLEESIKRGGKECRFLINL